MIKIVRKEDCCGCTACESSCGHKAITFKTDDEGFIYPEVDLDRCTDCGLCEAACPIVNRRKGIPEPDIKGIFAARVSDREICLHSSSGGAFSALALEIISRGGKVVGAVYDENMQVVHAIASTPEELAAMRGSKYSQSNLIGLFREIRKMLVKGELVLFTGTPCQVSGLKLFLRKDFENLYTVDLVCHAVPSPKLFREYVEMVDRKFGDRLVALNMRDKEKKGWSHSFSYRYIFRSGKVKIDTDRVSSWSRLFFSKMIDRPSCHECLFTNYSRPGDITIADFWDDRKVRPDLYSPMGMSTVIANTEKGLSLIDSLGPKLEKWPVSAEAAWQPCLEHPVKASPRRAEFWDYYRRHGFDKAYKKYFADSSLTKIKKRIKDVLRPAYHFIKGTK